MQAAKAWGLTPQEWRRESVDDQALMIAYEMFCATRESYKFEWQEQRVKRNVKGGGENPYQAMKRQMGLK